MVLSLLGNQRERERHLERNVPRVFYLEIYRFGGEVRVGLFIPCSHCPCNRQKRLQISIIKERNRFRYFMYHRIRGGLVPIITGQEIFEGHFQGPCDKERLVRPRDNISVFPRRKGALGDICLPVKPFKAGLLPHNLFFDHFPEKIGIHSVIL